MSVALLRANRQRFPLAKFILLEDGDFAYLIAVEPSSPWFEVLPDEQIVEVVREQRPAA